MNKASSTCAILGASGLVGSALVRLAAQSGRYATIRAIGRRPLETVPETVETTVIDFERLAEYGALFAVDHVFCCLGTTIRQAGSRDAFRLVDQVYPLEAARVALASGARQFLIVTAVGADSKSPFFYNRVKGELEDSLSRMSFPDGITVLHPSLLLGRRRERRTGEAIASVVMRAMRPIVRGTWRRYEAIEDVQVARAMLRAAAAPSMGWRVLEGADLFALAD